MHNSLRDPDREIPAVVLRFLNTCDGIGLFAAAQIQGGRLADFFVKTRITEKDLSTQFILRLGICTGDRIAPYPIRSKLATPILRTVPHPQAR